MGAADSFAGNTLADAAAGGENAPRAKEPDSPASELTDAGENRAAFAAVVRCRPAVVFQKLCHL